MTEKLTVTTDEMEFVKLLREVKISPTEAARMICDHMERYEDDWDEKVNDADRTYRILSKFANTGWFTC